MNLKPIGTIYSPFEQKLGIPRQPLLCPSVKGTIKLDPEFAREDTLRKIESFQFLWLLYWCHASESWRETIKPPRLGGKEKVGVFATRSPHRPNPIGMSLVKLEKVRSDFSLEVSGLDILNETPLLDIKPYLSLWDSQADAGNGWVDETPKLQPLEVSFEELDEKSLQILTSELKTIINETLCWDPRPAYTKDEERTFTHRVKNVDILWKRQGNLIVVMQLKTAQF